MNLFFRLPIVQGGTFTFVTPTIAILSLKECPYIEARKGIAYRVCLKYSDMIILHMYHLNKSDLNVINFFHAQLN